MTTCRSTFSCVWHSLIYIYIYIYIYKVIIFDTLYCRNKTEYINQDCHLLHRATVWRHIPADGSLDGFCRPVDFNRIPPWRQQTGSGVRERFSMWRTCFVDGLRLAVDGPVNFDSWAHRRPLRATTSGLLPPRWITLGIDLPYIKQSAFIKNYVSHTRNYCETALPAISHHVGRWSKMTGPTPSGSTVWRLRPADGVTRRTLRCCWVLAQLITTGWSVRDWSFVGGWMSGARVFVWGWGGEKQAYTHMNVHIIHSTPMDRRPHRSCTIVKWVMLNILIYLQQYTIWFWLILRPCQHDDGYARWSVTGLSPHRRTDPSSQRPVFPGGHPFKY